MRNRIGTSALPHEQTPLSDLFHVKPGIPDRTWPEWLVPHLGPLEQFADILATAGLDRGLLGPREIDRLWDRHLLNCVVVVDPLAGVVPLGSRVADVGSGAGLPGLAWAITRPDLRVTLVEPLLRRSLFLVETVKALGLDSRVDVVRARAEDVRHESAWTPADIATARAVAPLRRLLDWTVPLLRSSGTLIALKGQSAADEVAEARAEIARHRLASCEVRLLTSDYLVDPTTVVIAQAGAAQ